jgi:cell division septal protein FtsQ
MIRDIRITCREAGLENKVRGFLQGKKLGNILLFDNAELQASLKSIRPVKNVRVRKLFPSALEIQVEERTARAVIKQSGFHMVDEEGVLFETAGPAEISRLPLLIDSHDFVRDSEDKLRLARECLNGLSPEVLAQVAVVDLSESDRLSLVFRDSPIRFILGGSRLSEKIEAGRNAAARLEKEYGPLDSIDLRFEDRLYLGLKEVKAGEQTTDSGFPKEAT